MPAKPTVMKWTMQSSHTEHEQHKQRMDDLKNKPARIHDIQDREIPTQLVRSKIVSLSGLRSKEQERHWQVELSRHKHSLKDIDEHPTAPKLGAPPLENPFSLKRFKVAAEIETQNDRFITNLRNVKPTVSTARQCKEDAEVRRRARRHFQRYPTPTGPVTIAGANELNREHQHHSPSSAAASRSHQLPPIDGGGADDPRARTENNINAKRSARRRRRSQHDNNNINEDHNNIEPADQNDDNNNADAYRPLSYTEQLDVRERGWDSTTRVLYSHTSRGRSQPLEYLQIPSPLREPKEEHNNNNNTTRRSPSNTNNNRQLLASSNASGIQKETYSSSDDDDEFSSSDDDDDLSVNSNNNNEENENEEIAQRKERKRLYKEEKKKQQEEERTRKENEGKDLSLVEPPSKKKSQQTTARKPQPPAKTAGGKKGPQRINFLNALKSNPVISQKKSARERQSRDEIFNGEEVERFDFEDEQDEERKHLIFLEQQNNPEVLERQFNLDLAEKHRREEEIRMQRERERREQQEQQQDTLNRSASMRKQQQKKDEDDAIYTNEFLYKLDVLNDQEEEARVSHVAKLEKKYYDEWKADEEKERQMLILDPHARVIQLYLQNRAPVTLVRRLVLIRAKKNGRSASKSISYRASRDRVLSKAIENVRKGLLVDEDELARLADERDNLKSYEAENRDNIVGEEVSDRKSITTSSNLSQDEINSKLAAHLLALEKTRKEQLARPASKDIIDRALSQRESSIRTSTNTEMHPATPTPANNNNKTHQRDNLPDDHLDDAPGSPLDSARREQLSRPASREAVISALRKREEQLSRENSPVSSSSRVNNNNDANNRGAIVVSAGDNTTTTNDNTTSDAVFLTQQHQQEEEQQPQQQETSNNNINNNTDRVSPTGSEYLRQHQQQNNAQENNSISQTPEEELDSARRDRLSRPSSRDVIDSALRKRESQLSQRSDVSSSSPVIVAAATSPTRKLENDDDDDELVGEF